MAPPYGPSYSLTLCNDGTEEWTNDLSRRPFLACLDISISSSTWGHMGGLLCWPSQMDLAIVLRYSIMGPRNGQMTLSRRPF